MKLSDFEVRQSIAQMVGNRKVYDLGCGEAPFVKDLYERSDYIGIDCSEQILALAMRANPFYRFSKHDLSKGPVPVPDNLIDVALLIDVLEEFADFDLAEYVLGEAGRISKELIVVWNSSPPWPATNLNIWKPKIRIGKIHGFEYWSVT